MSERVLIVYYDCENVSTDFRSLLAIEKYSQTFWGNKNVVDLAEDWSSSSSYDSFFIHIKNQEALVKLKVDLLPTGFKKVVFWNSRVVFQGAEILQRLLVKAILYEDPVYLNQKGNVVPFCVVSSKMIGAAITSQGEVDFTTLFELPSKKEVLKNENNILDISKYDDLIQFFQNRRNVRFFNEINAQKYHYEKKSREKIKIKLEYMFHKFIPEELKHYFVAPSKYISQESYSSYCVEKYNLLDVSIQWLFGDWNKATFQKFLENISYFYVTKSTEMIIEDEGRDFKSLYVSKVKSRIETLKRSPSYFKIEKVLSLTNWKNIDNVMAFYLRCLEKVKVNKKLLVFSHGDPCFSNILYDKRTDILKFIDPKGAETESESKLHYSYDIAKLSHSILGDYDFINNGLFKVEIMEDLFPKLMIEDSNRERQELKQLFISYLSRLDIDYEDLRVLESSLFLSMLPLHLDDDRKVLGLLLNGLKILDKIKESERYGS